MASVLPLVCAVALLLGGCSFYRMVGSYYPGSYGKPRLPSGQGGYQNNNPYTEDGRTYYPLQSAAGYDQTGVASWYGRDFHGNLTADGERYDMYALSAAHRTLPLPTLVRVTNLENGRAVVVRVNDRGPFVKNRLIDLSYAAALELGFANEGTARVRVQSLESGGTAYAANTPSKPIVTPLAPPPAEPVPATARVANEKPVPGMYIQVGAFSEVANAERLRGSLLADYPSVRIQPFMNHLQRLYRVRIGPYSDVRNIENTVLGLQHKGYNDTIVVIE
jgi:peptidoglycan lytic transglycosylase